MLVRIRPLSLKKVYFFNKTLTKPAHHALFRVILGKSTTNCPWKRILKISYKLFICSCKNKEQAIFCNSFKREGGMYRQMTGFCLREYFADDPDAFRVKV